MDNHIVISEADGGGVKGCSIHILAELEGQDPIVQVQVKRLQTDIACSSGGGEQVGEGRITVNVNTTAQPSNIKITISKHQHLQHQNKSQSPQLRVGGSYRHRERNQHMHCHAMIS